MQFEWDPRKDRANQRKHGLSFQQASKLFTGPSDFLEIYDAEHSIEEDRFIAIGTVDRGVIVVAYAEREDDRIRILSARRASAAERQLLREHWRGRDER